MTWLELKRLMVEVDSHIDDKDEIAVNIGYKADNINVHCAARPASKQLIEGWIKHDQPAHTSEEDLS